MSCLSAAARLIGRWPLCPSSSFSILHFWVRIWRTADRSASIKAAVEMCAFSSEESTIRRAAIKIGLVIIIAIVLFLDGQRSGCERVYLVARWKYVLERVQKAGDYW